MTGSLARTLSLKDLVFIVIGTVIGSGIFLVPGTVLRQSGGAVGLALLVWLVAGILSLLGALTYGELGAMRPDAGGLYVYIRDAFGPLLAFLYGWMVFIVGGSGAVATLAVAFTSYARQFVPLSPAAAKVVAVLMIVVVMLVNVRGTRQGATVQNWSTALKAGAILVMSILLLVAGSGFAAADTRWWPETVDAGGLAGGVGLAMIAVLWAYEGWHYVTFSAGEALDPQRTFPRGIVAGTAVVIALYVLANVAYVAALGAGGVMRSDRVAAEAMATHFGGMAGRAIAAVILVSIFSAANGLTLTAPRLYYAMARDGLFFKRLAEVSPRFGTPAVAIVTSSIWAMALAATGTFEQLLTYVVFMGWVFFALAATAIFTYRRREPDAVRPFRTPGYPVTPILFIVSALAIVVNTLVTQPVRGFIGLGGVALGVPIYYVWRSRRGPAVAVCAAFALAASAPGAGAQTTARGTGPDTSVTARVDRIFAHWDRNDSPGCALGVFRDGRIAYARGYGMANLELGVALSPRSVLDIASVSKQFTAMAVVLLAQRGQLSLDDDVRKFIPELPAYGRPITIRHLLTHTSGLRDYATLWYLAGVDQADFTTDEDALELITRQKAVNFGPGEHFLYSNSGYFLASVIVERASGKSLAQYADEHIFRPLGMHQTRFNDDHTAVIANRATGHERRPDGGYAISMSDFEQTGDGAVLTSIEDLQRWDENFYTGQVGGRAAIDQLHQRAVLTNGRVENYALGLIVDTYRGLRRVRHGGSWAGYRAELIRFPDEHFSVAVLCNLAGTNPAALAQRVAEAYLEPAFAVGPDSTMPRAAARRPVALALRDGERYAGLYRSTRTGEVRRVIFRSDSLLLSNLVSALPLESTGPHQFRVIGNPQAPEVRFESSPGPSRRLDLFTASGDTIVFERIAEASPSVRELGAYAGRYWSEEIAAEYRLEVRDGALVLRRRRSEPVVLTPTYADAFMGQGVSYRFLRNRTGVSEMRLDAGRIRNLRFVRRGP